MMIVEMFVWEKLRNWVLVFVQIELYKGTCLFEGVSGICWTFVSWGCDIVNGSVGRCC